MVEPPLHYISWVTQTTQFTFTLTYMFHEKKICELAMIYGFVILHAHPIWLLLKQTNAQFNFDAMLNRLNCILCQFCRTSKKVVKREKSLFCFFCSIENLIHTRFSPGPFYIKFLKKVHISHQTQQFTVAELRFGYPNSNSVWNG